MPPPAHLSTDCLNGLLDNNLVIHTFCALSSTLNLRHSEAETKVRNHGEVGPKEQGEWHIIPLWRGRGLDSAIREIILIEKTGLHTSHSSSLAVRLGRWWDPVHLYVITVHLEPRKQVLEYALISSRFCFFWTLSRRLAFANTKVGIKGDFRPHDCIPVIRFPS